MDGSVTFIIPPVTLPPSNSAQTVATRVQWRTDDARCEVVTPWEEQEKYQLQKPTSVRPSVRKSANLPSMSDIPLGQRSPE